MTKDDHLILEELYINSKIKKEIKRLISEGKSKDEIEHILSEAGFFNKLGKGLRDFKQNYWDDPRAIKAGQKASYGKKGQEARSKGQTAYNRQAVRKFQKEIQSTIKFIDKAAAKDTYAMGQRIFKAVDKLFKMMHDKGPNMDPNFLIQQFNLVQKSLEAGRDNSLGAVNKTYMNLINQIKNMSASMSGGMQQAQQPQAQQQPPPVPQQPAPPQAPPPAAGTPRNNLAGAYNNQNVAGQFAQPNTQVNASTEVRIHKKDFVLMESAYDQVVNRKK